MNSIALHTQLDGAPNWIISQRDDLIWFIGGPLATYAVLALAMWGPAAVFMPLVFVWAIGINGPHFFATASRTYFDREQRQRLSWLLLMLLPVSAVTVPIALTIGDKAFIAAASFWGVFHITKQHIGLIMLYKRKNRETDKRDSQIDKYFFLISQLLPVSLFTLLYLNSPLLQPICRGAVTVQIVLVVGYLTYQTRKYQSAREMNWPKLLLVAIVFPLHWLAFLCAVARPDASFLIFTIGTNFGHALQYHRITWFHNHNRYTVPDGKSRHGFAAFLGQKVLHYYLAAFVLSLTLKFLPTVAFDFRYRDLLLSGPIFMHYLLDSRIWRVRGDPELAAALRLS
jgi:hypothetical protein